MPLNLSTLVPFEERLHGVAVIDPYRWLEVGDSVETRHWIYEQNCRCEGYFSQCADLRILEERVRSYLAVTVLDQPFRCGDHLFYRRRDKDQQQASLYVQAAGVERVLVEPSKNQPFTSFAISRISPDRNLLAYEVKQGGQDRKEIHVIDIRKGSNPIAVLRRGLGRGFHFSPRSDECFYIHESDEDRDEHLVFRHRLGCIGPDEIVFRAPKRSGSRLTLIGDAHLLGVLWTRPKGPETVFDFSVCSFGHEHRWSTVFRERTLPYNPLLCHGRILVLTETSALGSEIIELSPDGRRLKTVVPATGPRISQIAICRERIYVSYVNALLTHIEARDLSGHELGSVDIPSGGTVRILPVQDQHNDGFFYSYESFDTPPSIFEYCARTRSSTLWHQRELPHPNRDYEVQSLAVPTESGAAFPLTLVSGVSPLPRFPRPILMTSYGGFGRVNTPQFSVLVTVLLDLGASFAIPHIRGGGEFGKQWHDAGRRRRKKTAILDFVAAAEWLCAEHLTTPAQLGIFGGSNSGLLVGAAMTQRPDLFGAVLAIAPLLDMIRYHEFDDAERWRDEFGTAEDPDDFRSLLSYCPYHHVSTDINYPPALFVSGDNDDRCNPCHARKMVALLQNRAAQNSPILLDYSEQRGHSAALPLAMRVSALARRIAFVCRALNIPVTEGGDDEAACA